METFAYKKIGKLEVKLDLHRLVGTKKLPLAVWIHGGALITGHREGLSNRVTNDLLNAGFALASIDYRLAPETSLPAIIEDLEDAFRWLQNHAEDLNIQAEKVAVLGSSAGGYLTFTAGYRVQPRPTCLVPFWGYGDLVGGWYRTPSNHPRHNHTKLSEEYAHEQVNGPPISDSRQRKGNGGDFYSWCRQTGQWPLEVTGWDPHSEPEKFFPFMPIKNVSTNYPPTLMVHGTSDTDVPFEQSILMQQQFLKHGVEHELVTIKNGEHGLSGGDAQQIDAAYKSVLEFVKKHMLSDDNTLK